MLLNLDILNGMMSPFFDKFVDVYTVSVSNDVDSLILNYEAEEGYTVEVKNNDSFIEGPNYVFVEVKNEENVNTYTLEVYKEYSEAVINYDELTNPLEVEKQMPSYMPYLIGGICFFIILCSFLLLFRKKKK